MSDTSGSEDETLLPRKKTVTIKRLKKTVVLSLKQVQVSQNRNPYEPTLDGNENYVLSI